MMRKLSVVFVVCAVAVVVAAGLMREDEGAGGTGIVSQKIKVVGEGNTLASLAERINDPALFRYDPETRVAVAHCSLVIEGELTLGRPGEKASREFLEFDTEWCGDLRMEVAATGKLHLYNSVLRTTAQVVSFGACTRGYALFVDGELKMEEESHISYLSGSESKCLRGPTARATLRDSTFSLCDGNAFSFHDADGANVTMEDCVLRSDANWGLLVSGSGGEPLELRNVTMQGKLGSIFVTGDAARVRLIDCVLQTGIAFNRASGEVQQAWTRWFKVVDKAGRPRPDVIVRAQAAAAHEGDRPEVVEGKTNQAGVVSLVLTDWVARPGANMRAEGRNTTGGHRIFVVADGKPIPARLAATATSDETPGLIRARGKGDPNKSIEIRLP